MIRYLLVVGRIVGTLGYPTASAGLVAAALQLAEVTGSRSVVFWIAAAPAIYVAWLLTLVALYALDVQIVGGAGQKPRRLSTRGDRRAWLRLLALGRLYRRAALLQSLPFGRVLVASPVLRNLGLLAYAPRVRIGKRVMFFGEIFDPDLTEIGDRAVIGANAKLVAHTLTAEPDGHRVFASAPIVVGEAAVIGGESFVGMGVRIGAGALVELGSTVLPFTVIPAGEVWGGNPAVFRRRRSDAPLEADGEAARDDGRATARGDDDLLALVASALDLPPDRVHAELSRACCDAWDSLGQMAIAAAVYDRFGVALDHEQIFSIDSLGALDRALDRARAHSLPAEAVEARPADDLPDDPEMLPLGPSDEVTRALAARPPAPARATSTACIAASFTAQPLAGTARLWSRAFGIDLRVAFCDFDQVVQALVGPDSPFRDNERGPNLVLVRPEDLRGRTRDERRASAEQIVEAIAAFDDDPRNAGSLVVGSLPPPVSDAHGMTRGELDELRSLWNRGIADAGVEVLDFAALVEEVGTLQAANAGMDAVARAPYSPRLYQAIGIALARIVRRRSALRPPAKVVAVDADGTLWGGVLGEDGIDAIEIGDDGPGRSFRRFQRSLLDLKRRGILLALVSRNEPSEVWRVFDEHPGMVLSRRDIAAARIDWADKSANLREIADELNVGLDSFVFVDDDPAVRLEVGARAPEVHVVPLPREPERYVETLSRLWIFDGAAATGEDRARTRMIHEERERRRVRAAAPELDDYLRQLELVIECRRAGERDLPRVAQLVQKTNQFNLTLRRRGLDEIRRLASDHEIWVAGARDRFGDYGTIGVGVVGGLGAEDVELDTFLLSCRALGRGIEEAFLARLCERARERGARRVVTRFVEGPRNEPARGFLDRSDFVATGDGLFAMDLDRPGPNGPEAARLVQLRPAGGRIAGTPSPAPPRSAAPGR